MIRLLAVMGQIARALDRIGGWIVLPVMTFMMTLDVILRYVFNSPFIWGFELAGHLLILVFLMGILQCTRTDGNIRMDLVYLHIPERGKRLIAILYSAIGMFIFYLLAAKALKEIPFLMSIPESTEYLHLPIGGYYAFLVVISALMFVYFTLRAITAILGVDVPEEAPAAAIEEME
jgi:TRAP-type C4-dicarboxylate transport system permease small subunit